MVKFALSGSFSYDLQNDFLLKANCNLTKEVLGNVTAEYSYNPSNRVEEINSTYSGFIGLDPGNKSSRVQYEYEAFGPLYDDSKLPLDWSGKIMTGNEKESILYPLTCTTVNVLTLLWGCTTTGLGITIQTPRDLLLLIL